MLILVFCGEEIRVEGYDMEMCDFFFFLYINEKFFYDFINILKLNWVDIK